jgi:hypothetical protein
LNKKAKCLDNRNIIYTHIDSASQWLQEKEEENKCYKHHAIVDNAYVYCISPKIRYSNQEVVHKKDASGKIKKIWLETPINYYDKFHHYRNNFFLHNDYPKNFPQLICKIGHSENISGRIKTHRTTLKRNLHIIGMIRFPDISSAKSFEYFCFDFYKKYKLNQFKSFFKSNEIYLMPVESLDLHDALTQYMKSQKNLEVEKLIFRNENM